MDELLEMGTGVEVIFNPHKCPERASTVREGLSEQVDKMTYPVDVNFFPHLPWFLFNGPTYRVAMMAGKGAIHSVVDE